MPSIKRFDFRTLSSLTLTILWVLSSIFLPNGIFKAAFSVAFLLLIPGYFSYRLLTGYRKSENWKILTYALGLSIIGLMLIGLLVNESLYLLGDNRPLATTPLALSIGSITGLLIIVSALRKPKAHRPKKLSKKQLLKLLKSSPIYIIGALLPFIAVGGANTLNNGGSNWMALVAMGLVGLYFLLIAWKETAKKSLYPYALYVMTLTLLLGTSFRGWNITGHDIMQEYQVFQLTAQHAAWHMQYYRDAYMACLSITILPTIFRNLTGISDPYIYKFVFQLFFAFLPPIMYITLRKYVAPRIALFAAFVFITFPTFLTDITMLNRQETAFLCLALSLQAGLDQSLKRRQRSALVFIFLLAVVLSHYSTSYIALGVLFIAAMLSFIFKYGIKRFRRQKRKPSKIRELNIYTLPVIVSVGLILIAWNVLATDTAGNISRTLNGLTGLSQPVSTVKKPQVVLKSTDTKLNQYASVVTAARPLTADEYYPVSSTNHPLVAKTEFTAPENTMLASHNVPVSVIHSFFDLVRQVYALIIEGLIVLGVGLMFILRQRRTRLPSQYIILGLASLCMVGLQVVIPSSLINYGLLRALQQSLLFLALPIIIASYWLLQFLRIPDRWLPRVIAMILVGFFLVLSGFLPALTGGFKPALALSNDGFYYEAYYTHQDAISADKWLAVQAPIGSRVYSDEFTRRQLITYAGIFSQPTLVPATVPIDSYVYLSYSNTKFNDIPVYYNGTVIFYTVPYNFLSTNKNLLYNSSQVEIYK